MLEHVTVLVISYSVIMYTPYQHSHSHTPNVDNLDLGLGALLYKMNSWCADSAFRATRRVSIQSGGI